MAIHARHVDVADHQAEGLAADNCQRLLRRTHRLVVVPREQQRIGQCLAQRTVVLDQQNLDAHLCHSAP
ncbi:hypothetical protein D3C77_796610 [compost metagenome]